MTEEEIYKKIESVYKTEKGKNFISHLIRSFFPIDKANFMFGFEEDKKREMKCCITGETTYTKEDLLKLVIGQNKEHSIFVERLMINAHEIIGGEKKEASPELLKFEEDSLKMKQNLAVISEHSDKVLSQLAFRQLHNFVASELLRDNGHINWLLGQERAKAYINDGEKKGWIKNKKEKQVVEKVVIGSHLSLSENETLLKLKARLESEKE